LAHSRSKRCETESEKCDVEEAAEDDIAVIERLLQTKPKSTKRRNRPLSRTQMSPIAATDKTSANHRAASSSRPRNRRRRKTESGNKFRVKMGRQDQM
jgi:hypothetical protein